MSGSYEQTADGTGDRWLMSGVELIGGGQRWGHGAVGRILRLRVAGRRAWTKGGRRVSFTMGPWRPCAEAGTPSAIEARGPFVEVRSGPSSRASGLVRMIDAVPSRVAPGAHVGAHLMAACLAADPGLRAGGVSARPRDGEPREGGNAPPRATAARGTDEGPMGFFAPEGGASMAQRGGRDDDAEHAASRVGAQRFPFASAGPKG